MLTVVHAVFGYTRLISGKTKSGKETLRVLKAHRCTSKVSTHLRSDNARELRQSVLGLCFKESNVYNKNTSTGVHFSHQNSLVERP